MQVASRPLHLFFFAFTTAFVVSPLSRGDEPPAKAELAKKYKELVQQLASPNQPATTRNRASGSVTFPAKYDVKAQEKIDAVRRELQSNAQDALPYLVEALDDDKYCMTISWAEGQAYYNRSVGEVCHEIISSQLEVYRSKLTFSKKSWHEYEYPISKEWYETRKKLSLAKLQIEAIDWAIEKRKAEGDEHAGDRRGQLRKNEVPELERLRDGIAKTKKPTSPRKLLHMVTSNRGSQT